MGLQDEAEQSRLCEASFRLVAFLPAKLAPPPHGHFVDSVLLEHGDALLKHSLCHLKQRMVS